jgi:hypothetical protein
VIVGPSDEPYVITVGVSVEGGGNRQQSAIHPVGDPDQHYGDVDDGEFRRGPIAAVWSGPEQQIEVSIVTVVMENDEGDAGAFREEVETVVSAAIAVVTLFNPTAGAVGAALKGVIQDLAVWVIGSSDDEIGTAVTIITPEFLKRYPTFSTQLLVETRRVLVPFGFGQVVEKEVVDETTLEHHFRSRHRERGEYVVTYKIEADHEPVTQPSLSVDFDIGNAVLVVAV